MKLNKIMILFALVLPISLALRFFQILYAIDLSTGFFKKETQTIGVLSFCLIGAACLALAVFSHFSFRSPIRRRKSVLQAIPSLLCAAALAFELVSESFAGTILFWQSVLLIVSGIATVLLFLVYGVSLLTGYSLPAIFFAIPPVYFIIRIVCSFTAISSLALISDHVLLMATYCTGLLFFLNLGKLYNQIDEDHTFRKLLGSGLCFILLAVTESLPYLAMNLLFGSEYAHTTFPANLSAFAFALFASMFFITSLCKQTED